MKKYIKIGLIVAAVAVVVGIIVFAIKAIATPPKEEIMVTDFTQNIQTKSDSQIKGNDYDSATKGFDMLLGEIKTEAFVSLTDGQKSISQAEADKAKTIIFLAYAPIFTDYADSYFKHSSWDERDLNRLKSRATSLLNMQIAENGTETDHQLHNIVNNVNEYYAAWKVARSASHCSTVNGIADVTNRANNYRHAPLTNNASLAAALAGVGNTAKDAVVRKIAAYCDHVSNNYSNYSSYQSFYADYGHAIDRINEYKHKYGEPLMLKQAHQRLDNADYYAQRQLQSNNV